MSEKSKSQKRRKEITRKESTPLKVFTFADGKKISAKNYADALDKRNKMMDSPPSAKSM